MRPTVDALARTHRVLTFSLTDTDGLPAFPAWSSAIDRLLDEAGERRAAVIGASFGGLAAVRYAASRPDRVAALVLVSPPAPGWRLDPQSAGYVRRPRAALPLFAWRSFRRLTPEIVASLPSWTERLRFALTYGVRVLRWPVAPRRMAAWVLEWMDTDLVSDCRNITAPTLIITGEPRLDRVVEVSSSLEYLKLVAGARHVTFTGTGHVGLIARPREFAALVDRFLAVPGPGGRDHDRQARPRPMTAEPLECG
jgi:pimeloyl-ACP methyl ester carboxylesterase